MADESALPGPPLLLLSAWRNVKTPCISVCSVAYGRTLGGRTCMNPAAMPREYQKKPLMQVQILPRSSDCCSDWSPNECANGALLQDHTTRTGASRSPSKRCKPEPAHFPHAITHGATGEQTMNQTSTRQSWIHWWRIARMAQWGPMPSGGTMRDRALNTYTRRECGN